jgi:hypothetical protein
MAKKESPPNIAGFKDMVRSLERGNHSDQGQAYATASIWCYDLR